MKSTWNEDYTAVFNEVACILDSRDKADEWMNTPHAKLGDRTPIEWVVKGNGQLLLEFVKIIGV